jgi:hypothetical protein
VFAAAHYNFIGTFFWVAGILSFNLFPAIFGFAAFQAAKMPTSRFHLAKIGYKSICACLWVIIGMQVALCLANIAVIIEANSKSEQIETSLNISFVMGVTFFFVAYFALQGPRSMRNAGAIASILSFVFAALVAVQQIGQSEVVGHNLVLTALIMAVLMTLTAIAGAILMWMQRPAKVYS